MATKVADMTVDELKQTIRDVVLEVITEETNLRSDFSAELESRLASEDLITHEEVWTKD